MSAMQFDFASGRNLKKNVQLLYLNDLNNNGSSVISKLGKLKQTLMETNVNFNLQTIFKSIKNLKHS